MKRNHQIIVWSTAVLVAAVLATANLVGWTQLDLLGYFWPTVFLLSGAISLFSSLKNLVAYLLIGVGTFLIAQNLIGFELNQYLFIPIVLVLICSLLSIKLLVRFARVKCDKSSFMWFSKRKDSAFATELENKDYTSVFSKHIIDLTNHNFSHNIMLDITTMFGVTKVYVPSNIKIVVNPTAFFGGVETKAHTNQSGTYTLTINAFCLLGTIEILNESKVD